MQRVWQRRFSLHQTIQSLAALLHVVHALVIICVQQILHLVIAQTGSLPRILQNRAELAENDARYVALRIRAN